MSLSAKGLISTEAVWPQASLGLSGEVIGRSQIQPPVLSQLILVKVAELSKQCQTENLQEHIKNDKTRAR